MKAWSVVANGQPLQCIEVRTPEPTGSEILLEVIHAGVCHSDLHFWRGSYDLGGGKTMSLKDRGVSLPRAPGHEIVGRVVKLGPQASGAAPGDVRAVYPWFGCGKCAACREENDNLCLAQRSLGVIQDGGFASYVKVPDVRYLVDIEGLDPALAATYPCSGITVYAAVRKILPLPPHSPIALIGAGGLGLAAIAMLRAFGHQAVISVDVDERKREAARVAGATKTVDGSGDGVAQRIIEAAGGPVKAAIDFVNSTRTARSAFDALGKGGKLVLVGIAGGEITLSLAGLIFRAQSVMGSLTGSPKDLREVVALAKAGKLASTPVERFPKHMANEVLQRLHQGGVTGRAVLVAD